MTKQTQSVRQFRNLNKTEKRLLRNLKYLRNKTNNTQQSFADKIGVSRSMIGSWEELRAIPTTETLQKISTVFKISIDELVRDELNIFRTGIPLKKVQKVIESITPEKIIYETERYNILKEFSNNNTLSEA